MALTRLGTNAITSVPSSAITALPAGLGGKVLQVVTSSTSTIASTTSTSYVPTNLAVSITPSSTSNKILIIFNSSALHTTASHNAISLALFRNSTELYVPQQYIGWDTSSSDNQDVVGGTYLDTPSSVSSISYNLQFKSKSGGSIKNVQANNSTSTITAMEITG